MADSATAKKLDGRHERTEQTRLRILAAARDLMLSGNLEPTTTDIAKHAGITTRTLFRHFAVAESLHRQMIQAAEHSVEAIMDEPFQNPLPHLSNGGYSSLTSLIGGLASTNICCQSISRRSFSGNDQPTPTTDPQAFLQRKEDSD